MFGEIGLWNQPGFIHDFIDWLYTRDAQKQVYAWLLTLALGGGLSSAALFSKFGWKRLRARRQQSATFQEIFGRYYLYYPPLIRNHNRAMLRVARLTIERDHLLLAKAWQSESNDNTALCSGPVYLFETFLQTELTYSSDQTHKQITLWRFQRDTPTSPRIACGVMCCVNADLDPYHVPVIVSERAISGASLQEGLKLLSHSSTITRKMRSEVFQLLRNAPAADPNENFEHINHPSGPLAVPANEASHFPKG